MPLDCGTDVNVALSGAYVSLTSKDSCPVCDCDSKILQSVLKMTRMRSKTVQKIGIATYIIRGHNSLVHKNFSLS
jgi:hypothetical protein